VRALQRTIDIRHDDDLVAEARSDEEIVAVTPGDHDGIIDASAKRSGTADVTITAGTIKKIVHVTVKAGFR
jgi:hypothetical protein